MAFQVQPGYRIPQGTAIRVLIKAVSDDEAATDQTGLTPVVVVISKNGQAFGNPSAGPTSATEVGLGWYYVDLSVLDTDTLGSLIVRATHASMRRFETVDKIVDAPTMGAAALLRSIYDGKVCIDTDTGTTGSVVGVNGTMWNPCKLYSDALLIAAALNEKKFFLNADTLITLTQDHINWTFEGKGIIDLNGSNVTDATFVDLEGVSGTATGHDLLFRSCVINAVHLPLQTRLVGCLLNSVIHLAEAGNYSFEDCIDGDPTSANPTIEFNDGVNVGIRGYHGGINLKGLQASNTVQLDSTGARVRFMSDCVGGNVTLRGFIAVTDDVVGGFHAVGTLTESQRFAEAPLEEFTVVADAGNTTLSFKTNRLETATDHWKDVLITFKNTTLDGQVKKCSGYNGVTKVITVGTPYTSIPAAGAIGELVNR